MDDLNKEKLEYNMVEFIRCVIRNAVRNNKLDNITIGICTDKEGLTMDYTLSENRKDYVQNHKFIG